jgi:hypothetical protein
MLMRKTSRKNKRQSRESGQAAVFLVLAMGLFLIGSMGFVVDGANLWFHRQSAQTAADAACTAGAMNMLSVAAGAIPPDPNWIGTSFQCSGSSGSGGNVPNSGSPPCQYAAFNGYTSSGLKANQAGSDVSVTFPGSFSSMPSCATGTPPSQRCTAEVIAATPYIQVNITDRVQTTFIGMLNGGHTVDVGAQAMCGLSNVLSAVPVLVLNPNVQQTMTANSNVTFTILNGPLKSIQVNSTDPNAVNTPSGNIDLSAANNGAGGDFAVAAREAQSTAGKTFNFGASGQWVDSAGVISDPFASIPPPTQPPLGQVDYRIQNCPGIPGTRCDHYHPGYYPTGILVQRIQGSQSGLAVFDPGIYYLDGDFVAGDNTCLRPNITNTGKSGTVFYFHGNHTLQISSQSGGLSKPGFDCSSTTVDLQYVRCAPNNSLLTNLPSGGLTGNVLLGPCEAPAGDPLQPYGDPLGSADLAGEQRGMLFFQDRDAQLANPPTWNSTGSFGLIGNAYFHYCNSTSSNGTGSGANCNPGAFTDIFNLGSGAPAYVVGNLVVDQLQLGQSNGNSPVTVSLNPNPQYHVLKASLLQ